MINRGRHRAEKPSFIPKFSDADLLRSVIQSKIWKALFMSKKEAVWILLKAIYYLKSEMFIAPIRAVFRHSFGYRVTGLFITLMSTLMIIGFNAKTTWGASANLFPFIAPLMPFFMDGEQMHLSAFEAVRSEYLMYFWMGYLGISIVHLCRIYRGNQQRSSAVKRGDSWLYGLVFKHMRLSETQVQLIIEPLIVIGLGYGLIEYSIDKPCGIFMVISGGCLFVQELQDAVMRYVLPK